MVHPSFESLDHRPWPLPEGSWRWRQEWHDLLFAHWPIPLAVLRPLVPVELELEEHDGTAWIGVVPFRMADVMLRGLPGLPGISAFPELNVRTYVTRMGKPGVWFFSLDAAKRLAVWAARRFFHLPYFFARMSVEERGGWIHYDSIRVDQPIGADLRARYRPTSAPYQSSPGSFDHWLTERYCLFARSAGGRLFCGEIHHRPWPLQSAEAEFEVNQMTAPLGIELSGDPILHFARRIDVAIWSLSAID